MQVVLFGQLTEYTNSSVITVNRVTDTDQLITAINKMYPALLNVKYLIAIDKKLVHMNTALPETASVALLPPFSGG